MKPSGAAITQTAAGKCPEKKAADAVTADMAQHLAAELQAVQAEMAEQEDRQALADRQQDLLQRVRTVHHALNVPHTVTTEEWREWILVRSANRLKTSSSAETR